MKFVVVGLGSIGSRHKRNLESLEQQVVECHRNDDLEKILKKEKPNGVFICNPTALHVKTALTVVKASHHIFLEKPISHSLSGVAELLELAKNKKLVLMVGYNLRFQSGLQQIKQQLDRQSIGRVYGARIEVGSYLPNWRPGTDYQKSYSAKKALGGGVLLDLSHEIDYAAWFFGKAKKVVAMVKKIPELKIETEALAELIIEFESGVIANIHMDYFQRKYKRSCEIVGSQGELVWNYVTYEKEGLDETYIGEIKNFIAAIKGEEETLISGEEAEHVLEIVEAAKKSSQTGRAVEL